MPASRRTPWLICYDIADPKRLCRVHRELSREAIPLQYSVFHICDTRRGINHLVNQAAEHMDPKADDLRAYPLLAASRHVVHGRTLFPDGVFLPSAGLNLDHETLGS